MDLQDLLLELVHTSLLLLQLIPEAAQLSVMDLSVVLHLFLQGSLWRRGRSGWYLEPEVGLGEQTSPLTFISAASFSRLMCSFSLSITSSSFI